VSESPGTEAPKPRYIFRWDLDKTYLHTEFDSFLDLVKTAMEKPERKRTVPGATALLREVRATGPTFVTILSGSPEPMRSALEAKLRLDGVAWDEFLLKPTLKNIFRGRFRALRDQVGYKLPALLAARLRAPEGVPEFCFGDDAEADALVYSLYADLIAGRVDEDTLRAVLEASGTFPDVAEKTVGRARRIAREDPIKRIFIHLERGSDPEFFRRYGPRVVPVTGYFQAALVLVEDAVLAPRAAACVAASVSTDGGVTPEELGASARDLVTRGHLAVSTLLAASEAVLAWDPSSWPPSHREALAAALLEPVVWNEPPPWETVDYRLALTEDKARWQAARKKGGKKPG
jgi:hypothetical protein